MSAAPDDALKEESFSIVKSDCEVEAVDAGVPELDNIELGRPSIFGRWLMDSNIPSDAVKNQFGFTINLIDAPSIERLIGSMPPEARGLDGIEIQYHAIDGARIQDRGVDFSRVRLIDPPAGAPRYLAPAGSGTHLYIPPGFAALVESRDGVVETLFVTEGEKKAIVGCLAGYPTVALAGVTQWAESGDRQAVKDDAEDAGRAPERLSADTPIAVELLDLIEKIEPEAIHVLYDSDGAAVETRDVKIAGEADKRFTQRTDKKWVMNPAVTNAAATLAAALRKQTGLPVSFGFVPHGSEIIKIEHAGKIKEVSRLTKRGFDDWLILSSDAVRATLNQQTGGAAKGGNRPSKKPVARDDEGYIPLGYTVEAGTSRRFFWSHPQQSVIHAGIADLRSDTWYFSTFGSSYCMMTWSITPEPTEKNPDPGPVFDIQAAKMAVIDESTGAGCYDENSQFGAGAWSDGKGGLEINCKTGRFRVDADGEMAPADRVLNSGGRAVVFPVTRRGDVISDRQAEVTEIEGFIKSIAEGWNLKNKTDVFLVVGWTIMQAYTAAGPVRPNLFLTGQTSSGKSALALMIRAFLGPWSWYVNDSNNASPAFIRGKLGSDVMTICLDEAEPPAAKIGASGRMAMTRDHIAEVVRALKPAYNASITTGGGIDELDPDSRAEGEMSAGGKGTASGGIREERMLACGLFSAISTPDTDQAIRDRMVVVEVGPLTDARKALGRPPEVETKRLGGRVFAKMWANWGAYRAALERITPMINSRSPKIQQTLAAPIAALAIALDLTADSPEIISLVGHVNAERCHADSDDAPRTDHESVLDTLMSTSLKVEPAAGGQSVTANLATVISEAVRAGMGDRGPRGGGGDWGAALKIRGMSARRDPKGGVRLFIAKNHAGFRGFAQVSYGDIYATLARAPGVEPAVAKSGGPDNRVKLDGRKGGHSGIWIPVEIDADEPSGPAGGSAEALFDQDD